MLLKRMAYQISRVKGLRSIPLCVKFMAPKTDLGVEIWGTYNSNNQMGTIHVTLVKEHQSHVDPDPRLVGLGFFQFQLGLPSYPIIS